MIMNKTLHAALFAALLVTSLPLLCLAEEPRHRPLPSRMTDADAAKFDAARGKLVRWAMRMQYETAEPTRVMRELAAKYKIDLADIDAKSVVVDSDGNITRGLPSTALMPPPAEIAPAKK